jgi:exopolysaccharide production protein ExoY
MENPLTVVEMSRPKVVSHATPSVLVVPRWKRILDIALIVAALPLLVPVAVLVALVIKVVSKGPVLFRQERMGFGGQPFTCLKFRTMQVDAAPGVHQGYLESLIQSDEPMTKMDMMGDPRLIPLGSLLRSSGLDEMPQFVNVLRGEMSIVGPRPCTPYEYAKYTTPQKQRFNSLPGLTGLWQVSGKNKTTFEEMVKMDINYVKGKSLLWDLVIIARTGPAILLQLVETMAHRKRRSKQPSTEA